MRGETAATRRTRLLAAGLGALVALPAGVALAGGERPEGSLRQVAGPDGCYSQDGSSAGGPGTCRNVRATPGPSTTVVSPDGRHAYVSSYGQGGDIPALAVFRRRDDGSLRQLAGSRGCHTIDGSSESGAGTCKDARNLDTGDATSIAISRDGRFVYVASQYDSGPDQIGGMAIFKRNRRSGALRQLAGRRGCVSQSGASEDGAGTCASARAVEFVSNLQLSPDERFLYASNYGDAEGIAVFKRSRRTGRVRQVPGLNGCITDDGTATGSGPAGACREWGNLQNPWDVAITRDGEFAYVASAHGPNLLQAFRRNRRGGLVPIQLRRGCVSNDGTSPEGPCVNGRGLDNPERTLLSDDERFMYVASYSNPSPVAVIDRNRRSGLLSQRSGPAACVSADGSSDGDAGACRDGRALAGAYGSALSRDGRTLYVPQYNAGAVALFRVRPRSGALRQLRGRFGCVTPDGSSEEGPGTCGQARALEGAYHVELAGRDVYVSAYQAQGVAHFKARR